MSQADDLLNSLSDTQFPPYPKPSDVEEHIIVSADRFVTVPEKLKRIAVQHDHDVETVTFDCPRYWDNHDMSKWKIYVNYIRKDGLLGCYAAENGIVDENDDTMMHFNWTISRNVTGAEGTVSFLVCIRDVDLETGEELNHWNSELCSDMYVSEGLEAEETILDTYADVITHLLERMDYVEEIATPEHMYEYVCRFLTTTNELREQVWEFMKTTPPTTPEEMLRYVQHYLSEHPPLFVIGPEKPGVKCLWFDTSGSDGDTDVTSFQVLADDINDTIYAQVEGEAPVYDFDIL